MLDEVVDVDLATPSRQQGQQQQLQVEGGTFGFTVKQERHDDHEINELAAKIVETNKAHIAKSLQQQQQLLQQQQLRQQQTASNGAASSLSTNGNQSNIMNFFARKTNGNSNGMTNGSGTGASTGGRTNGIGENASPNGLDQNGEKKPCDEESLMGHFGWYSFQKTMHIPYILRSGEKYCAVRIAESKLLSKYLNYLHQDIHSCTCVRSYYITETESRLLNDINIKHCDSQFGRSMFTHKDLVVRLSDVSKFWMFLDVCYRKLSMGNSGAQSEKCGFIRINKESVVPYTVST